MVKYPLLKSPILNEKDALIGHIEINDEIIELLGNQNVSVRAIKIDNHFDSFYLDFDAAEYSILTMKYQWIKQLEYLIENESDKVGRVQIHKSNLNELIDLLNKLK